MKPLLYILLSFVIVSCETRSKEAVDEASKIDSISYSNGKGVEHDSLMKHESIVPNNLLIRLDTFAAGGNSKRFNFYPDSSHISKYNELFPKSGLKKITGIGHQSLTEYYEINYPQLTSIIVEYNDLKNANYAFEELKLKSDELIAPAAQFPDQKDKTVHWGQGIYGGAFIFKYQQYIISLVNRCAGNRYSLQKIDYENKFLELFEFESDSLETIESDCGDAQLNVKKRLTPVTVAHPLNPTPFF